MDLFDAVNQGNDQLLHKFIKQGADVNEVDEQGFTALHYAVKTKTLRMVEALCKHGANVNKLTTEGLFKTPLYLAADAGDLDIVRCLVQAHASVDFPSDSNSWYKENGQTPLHRAAYKGHLNIVEFLVDEAGADVNIEDADGSTPLHLAAFLGRKDVVTFLTSKGADVDKEDSSGSTPLNCASDRGYLSTVSFLLQKGAQLCQQDANGSTALHRAARKGNADVMKHLLDSGADIEQGDKKGRTSLHIASRRGQKKCALLLIEREANINQTDKNGQTPLHHAANKGHLQMVEALLDHGSEIDHTDETGETTMHIASKRGHADILRYLLAQGAVTVVQNNDGQTPLECASDEQIRRILSRYQKDGVILDNEDDSLFDSGIEDDDFGGEPAEDELMNVANTVESTLDLWELCKELRMEDDIIAKALPPVDHRKIALQLLKSWSQSQAGNDKAKKKILKTIEGYQRIRSGKAKKYDVLLELLSTEIYTMTALLNMASKLGVLPKDVMSEIDKSSSPPTKQRLWDTTMQLLKKWVKGGGKRDELLHALQARHLTQPAEVVSTAIQQEPGLADSFSFTTIDQEGGDIQLGEGDVQVSLPPGALPEETCEVVTIKVPNHVPEIKCEEEEVQASPPVQCTPSGLTFDEPVKVTLPHCTSLENVTDETEVILYTTHGTAEYTREQLSREDYTITEDSVAVNVRHFSTFRVSMKKLRGLKVGFLPFHPAVMPRSRKPILQIFFYHMYKRNEAKICEEHEHLSQEFCKAAPPTEISMESLNEDLKVVCSDGSTEIVEEIAHTKMREKKSNKASFELDFSEERFASKNIRLTLFQGEHKIETSLFEVRMQEPEPSVPQQVAPDPGFMTTFEGCVTTHEEEIKVLQLSEEIPNGLVVKIGMRLGFTYTQARRFAETNTRGFAVDTTGTLVMLQEWLKQTEPEYRNDILGDALVNCDLVEIAEIYLPINDAKPSVTHEEDEVDEIEPSTPVRLVQPGMLERSMSSGYVGMVSSKHHGDYRIKSVTKKDSRKQSLKTHFVSKI